ncbi:hypothetical protein B0I37DRAFT_438019 [Chaetomium sp. MPI-CAGE-AT-0009]|nr:hypothetical protein B0I37DRAFT_438019 [Chaetomium sp. MPI-CAGE-AT-0009]
MAILDGQLLGLAFDIASPSVVIGLLPISSLSSPLSPASNYNLFFHPIWAVPGLKLWATSHIPYTLARLSGRLGFVIHALHEKYGDVVRVAPNRLSFTHPDAWREVRGHRKAGQGEYGKDPIVYAVVANSLLGAPRNNHTRIRRILSHGFTTKSI